MLPFHFLSCIVLPNIFLRWLRLKTLNDFLPALVPLLCRVVRCRKNFYWPMPQTKSVVKGKPTVQDTRLSSTFLVGFSTFWGEDYRRVHSSEFVLTLCSNYLPQINRKGFRLKTLYVFLPCPCSFAVSFWLFPPQHLTFWVIQQVLSKRNSMDVIVVHGMFPISCRIKYWARFEIDSVFSLTQSLCCSRVLGVDTQGW